MDDSFLNGIDEHFERLMKLNGNGRRNGSAGNGKFRDRTVVEILGRLEELSSTQKMEVLEFVRSLSGNSADEDFSQSLETESNEP